MELVTPTSMSMTYLAHLRSVGGAEQSICEHLLGVAEKSRAFAGKIGLSDQGELLGLLHDLGKYSKEFQIYLRSAVGLIDPDADDYMDADGLKGKVDHSTAGAQLVWGELSKQDDMGRIVGQILALCIASHHSGLIDCLSSVTSHPVEDLFTKRMDKPEDKAHLREVAGKMDGPIDRRFHELIDNERLIAGLKEIIRRIIIEDNVKGPDPHKNRISQFKLGLLVRYLFSCLIDADRLDTADFEKPKSAVARLDGRYVEWSLLTERLENHLQGLTPQAPIDEIRRHISDCCRQGAIRDKGIYTLPVPTGGGKTLASLRFALHHAACHKMDRIIYVIPYTSIVDQNADVVRGILEPTEKDRGRVVLEHHSNLTPKQQRWREKILAENWDAPVVFTTTVQLLDTLFGDGTRGARRMHHLANTVLVFDEIQTLPVRCVHLFCNAMNFLVDHCGSTVVLCTATQPLLDRVDRSKGAIKLSQDPSLVPDVDDLFEKLKRVEVLNQRKPGGWSDEEIAGLAIDEVVRSGSCLVIVNTKNSAQALYRLCKETEGIRKFHLSTHMCPAHRKEMLGQIRNLLDNNSPVLCVSTQLIEAGVDVDFGTVIRFTAGLDSIAQAAGRCNRNGRPEPGRVYVINPAVENLDKLTEIRCGKDITERMLDDVKAGIENLADNLLAPRAMNRYFEYYFFARRDEMEYPVFAQMVGRDDTLLNLLSTNSLATDEYGRNHRSAPNIYLRQSFKSANRAFKVIDAPTRGVIVPYGKAGKELINSLCSAFEVEKQFSLLREAQQYSVNIFSQEFEKLRAIGALHEIQSGVDIFYLADARYYHAAFGLSQTPEGDLEVLHV